MKQRFHTIIKPEPNGWFVGWVEEIPGTITQARSLDQCRENLREALELMLQTHRDEARLPLDATCIQEALDVDLPERGGKPLRRPAGAGADGGTGGAPLDQGPYSPAARAYQSIA